MSVLSFYLYYLLVLILYLVCLFWTFYSSKTKLYNGNSLLTILIKIFLKSKKIFIVQPPVYARTNHEIFLCWGLNFRFVIYVDEKTSPILVKIKSHERHFITLCSLHLIFVFKETAFSREIYSSKITKKFDLKYLLIESLT